VTPRVNALGTVSEEILTPYFIIKLHLYLGIGLFYNMDILSLTNSTSN